MTRPAGPSWNGPVRPGSSRSRQKGPTRSARLAAPLTVLAAVAGAIFGRPELVDLPGLPGGRPGTRLPWSTATLGWSTAVVVGAALLLAAASRLEVGLPVASRTWCLRGVDVVLPLLLVLAPSPWLLPGVVVATVAVPEHGRREWRVLEFPVLSALATVASAVAVADLAGPALGPGLAAVLAGVAGVCVREAVAAGAVAATARRPLAGLLRPRLWPAAAQAVVAGAFGAVVADVVRDVPTALPGLVLPGLLVVAVSELQRRREAEARLYSTLAAEQERLGGRSIDESAGVLLVATARLLGGADVELLLDGPEGMVRYTGDESGVAARTTTSAEALDDRHLLTLLSGARVRSWHEGSGSRPVIGFSVGRQPATGTSDRVAAPAAVAVARRPVGAAAFTREDLRVARALAEQAGSWLTRAQAGLVDGVGEAAQAGESQTRQFVVREAATRLTAAATAQEVDRDRLAEELRLVERAVAALVGDRRRGRGADRRVVPGGWSTDDQDGAIAARRGTDWTTTGVLVPPADSAPVPPPSLVEWLPGQSRSDWDGEDHEAVTSVTPVAPTATPATTVRTA